MGSFLSDNKFHRDYPAWFADQDPEHLKRHGYDKWKRFVEVGEGIEKTPEEFAEMFCDERPEVRAQAYREIAEYHGWMNFDDDPLTLSRKEVKERYKKIRILDKGVLR